MKKIILLFLIITFLTPLNAERLKLAILDFNAVKGTSQSIAERTTEWLRSEMITERFSVVEYSLMKRILDKDPALSSGCIKVSCAVRAGKVLSVQKVLIGTVKTVNKKIIATAEMIDVANGKTDFQHSETIGLIRNLDTGVRQFAKNIDNKAEKYITAKPDKTEQIQAATVNTAAQSAGQNGTFAGTWNTTYGMLTITGSGNSFTGNYYNGTASLSGVINGNRLDFTWRESTASGRGSFVLSGDGNSFSGYWIAGESTQTQWNGTRVK